MYQARSSDPGTGVVDAADAGTVLMMMTFRDGTSRSGFAPPDIMFARLERLTYENVRLESLTYTIVTSGKGAITAAAGIRAAAVSR